MLKSHSEDIGKRLFLSVFIIILSLLCLSIPLIVSHYNAYQKSKRAVIEIENLKAVSELLNQISKERGPANTAMSSSINDVKKNTLALKNYRQSVDEQIKLTFDALKRTGTLNSETYYLQLHFIEALTEGRLAVDSYLKTPISARNSDQLDDAIQKMFTAWDKAYDILKITVVHSKNQDIALNDYYTLILILAELRDQAGRVASNVMANITFNEMLDEDNLARAVQTQKQVLYLWDLINTIQPEQYKSDSFIYLHQQVKIHFIDQGLPIVNRLISESKEQKSYFLTGTELSAAMDDKFLTVIDFQKFLLNESVHLAKHERDENRLGFILTLIISVICLFAALFTIIFTQRKVLVPLIQVRDKIVEFSYQNSGIGQNAIEFEQKNVHSLHDALQQLQNMLKQRDEFEIELKNIANTDKLTGVANRFALEAYVKLLDTEPAKLNDLCLMIIDIDYFKEVNDRHGHISGDQVIQRVANALRQNIRATDMVVRFGGDEFLVLIEHLGMEHALKIAEKMRMEISNCSFEDESSQLFGVSISVGVAVGAESWKALLAKADQALFRAKAKGRNNVSN